MKDKYPMQPIMNGRFESNPIVDWLCTEISNMNDIAHYCAENDIAYKYQEQLAQLVGYSVGGYGSLSYVSDESCERAENQMNTDNLATQTPEEKQALDAVDFSRACEIDRSKLKSNPVIQLSIDEIDKFSGNEWKNGNECAHDCIAGFAVVLPEGLFFKPLGAGKLFKVNPDQLSKPETPHHREERERLEAAYDLYCEWAQGKNHKPFCEFKTADATLAMWLRVVDKANYRKESNQ